MSKMDGWIDSLDRQKKRKKKLSSHESYAG